MDTATLQQFVVALVRGDRLNLSVRQLAVLLTVYRTAGPHTVRGLAAKLNVSKPVITRALDRLGELDLTFRKVDPMDRRSMLVLCTFKGSAFLRVMDAMLADAARAPSRAEAAR